MRTYLELVGHVGTIPVWKKRNKGCSDKNLVTSSATLTESTTPVQQPTKETNNEFTERQNKERYRVA